VLQVLLRKIKKKTVDSFGMVVENGEVKKVIFMISVERTRKPVKNRIEIPEFPF